MSSSSSSSSSSSEKYYPPPNDDDDYNPGSFGLDVSFYVIMGLFFLAVVFICYRLFITERPTRRRPATQAGVFVALEEIPDQDYEPPEQLNQ